MTLSGRGGAREGAGRPRYYPNHLGDVKIVSLTIPEGVLAMLDQEVLTSDSSNRSKIVTHLLAERYGIDMTSDSP